MINGGEAEGIYETAEIQIPVGRVNVSVEVQSSGGLDKGDYVQFYKVVDGGKPVRMGEEIRGGGQWDESSRGLACWWNEAQG